jgi:hypothetical protein
MIGVVQLMCGLAEAPAEAFLASTLEPDCIHALGILRALGAVQAGPRPDSLRCRACDADHTAAVEFDPIARCYIHSCPEVGFVMVDDADLTTYQFRPEWLAEWLGTALQVASPLRRRALIPDRVWYLGDATCGDTQVTVVLARRISSQADLDRLASELRPIPPAEKGIVITTSGHVARQVQLPGGYEFLSLTEIVRTVPDGLALDRQRLGFWLRGIQPVTAKGAPTRTGRPSPKATIVKIFKLRRGRRLRVESDLAEAKAILAEWTQHASDRNPPGLSTVRGHVARLRKPEASS